ncbi:unnamed protein product [Musa hybrid cultivar]
MQPPKPHLPNLSYLIKERERGVSLLGLPIRIMFQPIINADPMLYIESEPRYVD